MRHQAVQLPQPSADAVAHSKDLISRIQQAIDSNGGLLSFRDYMQLALYAPGLGYYVAGSRKLGAEGDFVTAPEISPLFSHCLAQSIIPALQQLPEANILEAGAGSGMMAAEILHYLAEHDSVPERYYILELSGELRERQRQRIAERVPELISRVEWLDVLPEKISAVVLGNEVLDAMPVNIVSKKDGQWQEQFVCWQQERFAYQSGQCSDARLIDRMVMIEQTLEEDFPEGYTTEVNLVAEDWIRSLSGSLQQGLVLLVDYGFPQREYYHPQRSKGSLMCHYRHHSHDDPFVYPGLQDITAHVDFSAMAEVAYDAGFKIAGYTNQANFLIGSGLTELCQEQDEASLQPQLLLANQIKKLTMPHEMGELFKVIGFSKLLDVNMPGFMLRDLRNTL